MALLRGHLERGNEEIVLHFFFKGGNDMLQQTQQCFETLFSQLLEHSKIMNNVHTLENCIELLKDIQSKPISDTLAPVNTLKAQGYNQLISNIERVAKLLETTIYVLVDAVDESEELFRGQRIIHNLKRLARSDVAKIRVIISSRSEIDILGELADTGNDGQRNVYLHDRELPSDIRIINIDNLKNSEDLRNYLAKKLAPIISRRVNEKNKELHKQELQKVVMNIFERSSGDFTFAGLAVAFIDQPSRLSMSEKLEHLPLKIGAVYKKTLENLTPDQRDLVIFALKWVIWGASSVRISEIAEHYQRKYHRSDALHRKHGGLIEDPVSPNDEHSDSNTGPNFIPYYNPEEDPDTRDTIHHLCKAGRDFFRFDLRLDSLDVHQSVREWVLGEAEVFSKSKDRLNTLSPINGGSLQRDPISGMWCFQMMFPG